MKIPQSAKRVFHGVMFDVYQWQQEMFDHSFATFEMIKRSNTVQVIPILPDNTIAVSFEKQPFMKKEVYGLLGGRQNENENPLQSAQRELLEESGMVSNDWQLIRTYEPYHKIDWTIYYFVARNCKKIQEQQLDNGERITVEQVSFERFIEIVTAPEYHGREFGNEILRMQLRDFSLSGFKKELYG